MKKFLYTSFLLLIFSASTWADELAIPISLDLTTANHITVTTGSTAGEDTTFATTGGDPWFLSVANVVDFLPTSSDKITLEYKSDAALAHLQIFFMKANGGPAAATSCTSGAVAAASEWTTLEVNVGAVATWGMMAKYRFDFGNAGGKTISVRNIRLVTTGPRGPGCEFFYSFNQKYIGGVMSAAPGSISGNYISASDASKSLSFVDDASRGKVMNCPTGNTTLSDVSCIETVGVTKGANNSDVSYGTWVKLEAGSSSIMQFLMSSVVTGGRGILNLRYNTANTKAQLETTLNAIGTGNYVAGGYAVNVNEWTHVAVTANNTSKIVTLYINGESVGSNDFSTAGFAASGQVRLAAHPNLASAGTAQTLCGKMDDAFMYSKELTAAEMLALYNGTYPTDKCEFLYDFEETSAGVNTTEIGFVDSKWVKSTVAANNLSLKSDDNPKGITDGDSVLVYPSSNTVINNVSRLETVGLLKGSYNTDATYGMWVKINENESRPLQFLMSGVGGKMILGLRPTDDATDDLYQLESACDATTGLNYAVDGTTDLISPDQWTHVALTTIAADSTMIFYIDGEIMSHQTSNTHDGNLVKSGFSTFSEIRLGAHQNLSGGQGQTFSGCMDDVFMYSQALTSTEIKALAGITDTPTLLSNIQSGKVSLYPCPVMAGQELKISLPDRIEGKANVTVYDITGQVVHQSQMTKEQSSLNADLNAGQYILKISSASEFFTERFIVK